MLNKTRKPSKAGKPKPEYSSNLDHYLVNTGSESILNYDTLYMTASQITFPRNPNVIMS